MMLKTQEYNLVFKFFLHIIRTVIECIVRGVLGVIQRYKFFILSFSVTKLPNYVNYVHSLRTKKKWRYKLLNFECRQQKPNNIVALMFMMLSKAEGTTSMREVVEQVKYWLRFRLRNHKNWKNIITRDLKLKQVHQTQFY